MTNSAAIHSVAKAVLQARRGVAFTGAGISTDSGIPDFRSPGGVWARFQPVYYQDFLASAEARLEAWRQKTLLEPEFAAAQPNTGHRVLAEWESQGRLAGVITQNIDGLHQLAGSQRVVEIHGTARQIACTSCDARFASEPLMDQFRATEQVPRCPTCGGWLKSATISFGQALPPEVLAEAVSMAKEADLLLAIGSSLVVEPAASLPRIAKKYGATLVIINRDPTDQDLLADVVIQAGISESLAAIQAAMSTGG